MTGSLPLRIKHAEKFERSLKDILRKHYRRDRKGEEEFLKLLESVYSALREGSTLPDAKLEPWPSNSHQAGWELWKLRFLMPRLRGASSLGRLIYLSKPEENEIILAWLYTHDEFEGRPPDKTLSQLLRDLMTSRAEEPRRENEEAGGAEDG